MIIWVKQEYKENTNKIYIIKNKKNKKKHTHNDVSYLYYFIKIKMSINLVYNYKNNIIS